TLEVRCEKCIVS
ncbi:serine/threonine-kinase domain protein, partial [Chlamydia psittaci 84-8471/1]